MESSDTYALDFPSDNAVKEEETIEQVLFLLDKFCASDELYHEFTLAYDDLPRSYLVKHTGRKIRFAITLHAGKLVANLVN